MKRVASRESRVMSQEPSYRDSRLATRDSMPLLKGAAWI